MPRYIAFLRAINVGSHIVKMDRLRALFTELEFANVATFIASGNVIFDTPMEDAPALEQQIAQHLRQALGYEVATFLRTSLQLAAVAAHQPFPDTDFDAANHALYISFLHAPPTAAAQRKLMDLRTPIDDFHVRDCEVYWWCRTKLSQSSFSGALLEKTVGMPATMRNVTTVRKLAAKYPEP